MPLRWRWRRAPAGTLSPNVGAIGALLTSIASGVINLPIVAPAARDDRLTRRVVAVLATSSSRRHRVWACSCW